MLRERKVWCDEDTSAAVSGDFYVDCMGTWIIDPDGTWRQFSEMTQAERDLCSAVIALEKANERTEQLKKSARHVLSWLESHEPCGDCNPTYNGQQSVVTHEVGCGFVETVNDLNALLGDEPWPTKFDAADGANYIHYIRADRAERELEWARVNPQFAPKQVLLEDSYRMTEEQFYAAVLALKLSDDTRRALTAKMGMSVDSVKRWEAGMNAPHPSMRRHVFE